MFARFMAVICLVCVLSGCKGFERRLEYPSQATQTHTSPSPQNTSSQKVLSLEQIPWGNDDLYLPGLRPGNVDILKGISNAPEYHIRVKISKNLRQISGSETIKVTNNEGQNLDRLVFHLFPDIFGTTVSIQNLTRDGQVVSPVIDKTNGQMTIKLPDPLKPGQATTIQMDFSYSMPEDSSSNYNVFSSNEGLISLAHFYPMLAVFDDHGWHQEKPSMIGDPTYGDAAKYLVEVNAPDSVVLIASGTEVSRTTTDHLQTVLYAAAPARDFYIVAGENLVKEQRNYDGVTINSYSPSNLSDGSKAATKFAEQAIEIFDESIGRYPYSELDLVTTNTFALGVEYPGMIALAKLLYEEPTSNGADSVRLYEESVVAHEVGHQWFYNMVGNDQLNDPWLDESLTQFITYDYYRRLYSETDAQGFLSSLYSRWENVKSKDMPIGLPVSRYDEAEYSAIIYGRGPIFFVEMEKIIGKEAMAKFLKNYWTDYEWKIATPADLQKELETTCGCDLSAEFTNWIGADLTK